MNSQKDLDQLEAIARIIVGLYQSAEMIYKSHLFGYPGTVAADTAIYIKRNIKSLEDLSRDLSDVYISAVISRIVANIQSLLMTDKNMKNWVEDFTGLPISSIRKSTRLSIQKQDKEGRFTGDAAPPPWSQEQEYRVLINEASGLIKGLINQMDVFFSKVSKLSDGRIKNWPEEQRTNGRFRYIN